MSLLGFSIPLVTCPYCHVASPLSQFLIKLRGNGFSKKRLKCPSCSKVGARTRDNKMAKLEGNFPEKEEHYDDDAWEEAQGPDPSLDFDIDDPDDVDTDDFDEPDEDY